MLSLARRSLSLRPKSSQHHVFVRRNVVRLERDYHSKVSALPFVFSGDAAIMEVAFWASVGGQIRLDPTLIAKHMPGFKPQQPYDVCAMYIPVWYIDGEVTGTINQSGTEVPVTVQSLHSYMPGFTTDPLSSLAFPQRGHEAIAVPFTPDLLHQYGLDVSCLPYSISPAPLLEVVKSLAPSQSKPLDSVTFDCSSVEFSMLAAYPVLLPIYLLKYKVKVPAVPEVVPLTCVVQAHSKSGLGYFHIGAKELGSPLQNTFDAGSAQYLRGLLRAVGRVQAWNSMSGKVYGFSDFKIPGDNPETDSHNRAVMKAVGEEIRLKPNVIALQKHGVDMNHPCVRVFSREEVGASRLYLAQSGTFCASQEYLRNVTVEGIRSGAVGFEVDGKPVENPEAVFEGLKEQIPHLKAMKEAAKPQWLRDWQNSRG